MTRGKPFVYMQNQKEGSGVPFEKKERGVMNFILMEKSVFNQITL